MPSPVSLPASGSTSWYSWAQRIDRASLVQASVKDYGALGDGSTDDTAAINAAITANPGADIYIPPGTYMVNAAANTGGEGSTACGIQLNQAGTRILLAPGALLKAITNAATHYAVIQVTAADCAVIGGTIQGDVSTHTGSTGEWCYCIDINVGADRCLVRDIVVKEAWGDGIFVIGRPTDIALVNVQALANRRQGCSISDAIRPRIIGGRYALTGSIAYTAPGGGIDLEPDPASSRDVINAVIVGVLADANQGAGFLTASNARTLSATFTGCVATGNQLTTSVNGNFSIWGTNSSVRLLDCRADAGANHFADGVYINSDVTGTQLIGCTATGNGQHGVHDNGIRTAINGCTLDGNGGCGISLDTNSTHAVVSATICQGNGGGVDFPNQYDIVGTNARLIACLADPNAVSSPYGYIIRSTATNTTLIGCSAVGTFATANYTDGTSAAVLFPIPGAALQGAIASPATTTASLKTAVDAIRAALTATGITV